MRTYLHIDLKTRSVRKEEQSGETLARAGRYMIAKTLLESGAAKASPLAPANPLIFSAGPFAGTNFSNANRLSVGCKSPLTGGVKESNAGGTFAFAMGQLEISGITLNDASDDWVVIYIPKDGEIVFDDASPYMGKGNMEAAAMLHEKYGDKTSIALCGPVGEYQGLIAGIAFSDTDNRPSRLAARGGVGAVMGSKKVKAIVADKHKMPQFHERKKLMMAVKSYGDKIVADPKAQGLATLGTALAADVTNHIGALPVNNFSIGSATIDMDPPFPMGGEAIHEQNKARGGDVSHACMPGCQIKCSNVYVDKKGEEIVSPLEYETIGLLGTNCGLKDPDDVAYMNYDCNDLGIDTIEAGALIGVLMEAGDGAFGDVDFMRQVMKDMMDGTERGRELAQGVAIVGEKRGLKRLPVIKKQALSAYDPRVTEVTAISMMTTVQGADHTVGNSPTFPSTEHTVEELVQESYNLQVLCASNDSLGLCLFGRAVSNANQQMVIDALNDALGTDLPVNFYADIGRDTLLLERQFNQDAGFGVEDNELPQFFIDEPLPPTNKTSRLRADEVTEMMGRLLDQ
ncbi:aldehyde ferredoxin oxidoreductase C-terminal domain-containing protein [Magnetovibrio sp. PR-2]|uniref:aldehyde ferredoxin oxidoreductase C-terminal domain-containing protein n=1 Tax=Magnetovibrio sp. PR-2 TaxID=3120356 RepID=UPI002FCDE547